MTATATAPATVPAIAWEDACGHKHADTPACRHLCEKRGTIRGYIAACKRKGIVQRGTEPVFQDGGPAERPLWFCAQHDPEKQNERRVAELAPDLLDAVRELLPLAKGDHEPDHVNSGTCHRCKTVSAAAWLLERAEGRRGR